MIRSLLLFVLLSISLPSMAIQADTSAYQFQRLKINGLLAERSAKFGQYDLSLNARTGIFGLQTKNDLRNSNEILRGIILSDNNIFRELKVLMNYKDQEVQQVQSNASSTNKRIEAYMLTIKKLQQQNDELKAQTAQVAEKKDTSTYLIIVLSVIIVGWGIYSLSRVRRNA
ncbi:hypothetical protein SAMN06265348_12313 [Pedobacter westerhofensis]|uniref:Uncharacterized protein n=1 Tax=Pedobacter westerhofensis TaxID=425512 RepID=A0A521FTL7_9SPHI|nr:hypothetical protein [Pedobacter westerhofensis]SMO99538.1 hypothetical protein SAMN06265348_12313 [Pedobacter westerhofensis]